MCWFACIRARERGVRGRGSGGPCVCFPLQQRQRKRMHVSHCVYPFRNTRWMHISLLSSLSQARRRLKVLYLTVALFLSLTLWSLFLSRGRRLTTARRSVKNSNRRRRSSRRNSGRNANSRSTVTGAIRAKLEAEALCCVAKEAAEDVLAFLVDRTIQSSLDMAGLAG